MIALDTNVLARLLLADDPKQLAQVRKLLSQAQEFTAPVTVMLELVWVLETYELGAKDISEGLGKLLALPNFKPAHPAQLRAALALYAQGMDFADALHWQLAQGASALASFDRKLITRAQRAQGSLATPVVALPR